MCKLMWISLVFFYKNHQAEQFDLSVKLLWKYSNVYEIVSTMSSMEQSFKEKRKI